MGKRIHILSEATINKIAAGEVVENPASVVKELIENSIDAGAMHIQIEIVGGGFALIRIVDNGSGMGRDDAVLSLERHATSKIRSVEELNEILSMGFRGEALASIAAVSKMTISTSEGEVGTKVVCEGGSLVDVTACARQHGTTIEVRDLFFNMPARKKFQRSAAVSAGEISRMITKLSLAYPEVGFVLMGNDRELIRSEGGDLGARMSDVLGKGFATSVRQISYEDEGIAVSGFVGLPRSSRLNRSGQYLFVNRRCVTSPLVSDAALEGYGTMLQSKEYPIFVLHLDLKGGVDVNVHPQKQEIRFSHEEIIARVVKQGVQSALHISSEVPQLEISEPLSFPSGATFDEKEVTFFAEEDVELPWEEAKPVPIGVYDSFLLVDATTLPLLQGDGLAVIDLDAASARIHYEAILSSANSFVKQNLLFPETVELDRGEAEVLRAYLGLLDEVGLVVRPSGETTFIVDAIASFYEGKDLMPLLTGFLEELHVDVCERELLKRLAMRASSMARGNGHMLSDAMRILEELLKCKSPLFCPRGDATMVKVERDGIKSWFKLCGKGQEIQKPSE